VAYVYVCHFQALLSSLGIHPDDLESDAIKQVKQVILPTQPNLTNTTRKCLLFALLNG